MNTKKRTRLPYSQIETPEGVLREYKMRQQEFQTSLKKPDVLQVVEFLKEFVTLLDNLQDFGTMREIQDIWRRARKEARAWDGGEVVIKTIKGHKYYYLDQKKSKNNRQFRYLGPVEST